MKGPEAERKLTKLGWSHVRRTGQGHDIWESPSGERQLFALAHEPVNRNAIARIRQAERAAQFKEELMTTTSMEQIEQVALAATSEPPLPKAQLRVYRSAGPTPFAEVFWGEAEQQYLGQPTTVSVFPAQAADVAPGEGAVWRLTSGGALKVRTFSKGVVPYYGVAVKALTAVLPATGRTDLPAEELGGGFLMFLDRIKAVPTAQINRRSRAPGLPRVHRPVVNSVAATVAPVVVALQEAQVPVTIKEQRTGPTFATHAEAKAYMKRLQEARQGAPAPTQPVTAPSEPSPAGDPSQAPQSTSLPKRGASLDDLRAALDLLRTAVSDLGVTLHGADGSVIELRDVSFRGKV